MEKIQTQTISWVTTNALEGYLRNCQIRSIIWKIFLGVFKADASPLGQSATEEVESHEWKKAISKERKRYEHLKETHFIDPRKMEKEDDLINNNPLADNSSVLLSFFCTFSQCNTTCRVLGANTFVTLS